MSDTLREVKICFKERIRHGAVWENTGPARLWICNKIVALDITVPEGLDLLITLVHSCDNDSPALALIDQNRAVRSVRILAGSPSKTVHIKPARDAEGIGQVSRLYFQLVAPGHEQDEASRDLSFSLPIKVFKRQSRLKKASKSVRDRPTKLVLSLNGNQTDGKMVKLNDPGSSSLSCEAYLSLFRANQSHFRYPEPCVTSPKSLINRGAKGPNVKVLDEFCGTLKTDGTFHPAASSSSSRPDAGETRTFGSTCEAGCSSTAYSRDPLGTIQDPSNVPLPTTAQLVPPRSVAGSGTSSAFLPDYSYGAEEENLPYFQLNTIEGHGSAQSLQAANVPVPDLAAFEASPYASPDCPLGISSPFVGRSANKELLSIKCGVKYSMNCVLPHLGDEGLDFDSNLMRDVLQVPAIVGALAGLEDLNPSFSYMPDPYIPPGAPFG